MVIISLLSSFITLFESHNAADNLWRSKLPIASPEGHAALDGKAPCHRLVTLKEHLNHALKYLQRLILLVYHFFLSCGNASAPFLAKRGSSLVYHFAYVCSYLVICIVNLLLCKVLVFSSSR
jgi:hypothetical protein